MAHACNPTARKAEAGGLGLKVSWGPYLKKQNTKQPKGWGPSVRPWVQSPLQQKQKKVHTNLVK